VPHKVVNLGEVRDLLQSWEEVRQHIVKGDIRAFALTIQELQGREAVYYGGLYKSDPAAALKAGLRQSWELTKAAGSKP
jgi:hypothetical protein